MDGQSPKGSRHLRARCLYPAAPGDRSFRIEDGDGRLLRTIQGARHAQEAIALYWRNLGAGLSGTMMGNDLDRRIRRVQVTQTRAPAPELPFEAASEGSAATGVGPRRRGRAPRAASEPTPQIDLFEDGQGEAAIEASPERSSADDAAEAVSADQAQKDEAGDRPVATPPVPEPRMLDPVDVMLQRVDPRNLRPTDRADSYLYHVTNGPDAELALKQGLGVSLSDPVILTERPGVAYWLSVLAEDYDYILDGPPDFVVLRLRRISVEELLDHDAAASRSAGCPCFLLTGGGGSRETSGS